MGRRISKEFLHPSILEGVNNKIGNLDSLETDAKGNMVQAINELADKIDTEITEGKQLIASAIANELITVDSTFNAMSEAIEGIHADREATEQELESERNDREEDRQKLIEILTNKEIDIDTNSNLTDLIGSVNDITPSILPPWYYPANTFINSELSFSSQYSKKIYYKGEVYEIYGTATKYNIQENRIINVEHLNDFYVTDASTIIGDEIYNFGNTPPYKININTGIKEDLPTVSIEYPGGITAVAYNDDIYLIGNGSLGSGGKIFYKFNINENIC